MNRVPQLNRKPLSTNPNKQTRKSEFNFNNYKLVIVKQMALYNVGQLKVVAKKKNVIQN